MQEQVSEIGVLMNLGLTQTQARVYLALIQSGSSRTSTISRISKVARPDVYQILSKLQEIGLVEKIVKTPLEYKAIPINNGLSLLLKIKTERYEKIRGQTKILLDTAKNKQKNNTNGMADPEFVMIHRGRTFINRAKNAIEKAQLNMNLILSWKEFSIAMSHAFIDSFEIAWAKKLETRFILENPWENKTA